MAENVTVAMLRFGRWWGLSKGNEAGNFPPRQGFSNRDIVTTQWNQEFLRFLTVTIDENVTITIWTGGGDKKLAIEGQRTGALPPPEAISDCDK